MEDLRSLFIGVLGGLIVLGIVKTYNLYKIKSIREDIKFLEFEKNHLSEMKRSGVEMNRISFRAIFALFFLMGLANLTPKLFTLADAEAAPGISLLITMIIWAIFIGLCIKFWRRYDNLKNFKDTISRIDTKLENLRDKLPE
jgi:hypothetical protein